MTPLEHDDRRIYLEQRSMTPFSPSQPLTWFRRAERHFHLKKITRSITQADYAIEILPESVFQHMTSWLDTQLVEIQYEDLNAPLLRTFCPSPSVRARCILDLPHQFLRDFTPTQAWHKTAVSILIRKYVPINKTQVLCDTSTRRPRPLVPIIFRHNMLNVVHGLVHPSMRSTIKLIKAKFVWHTIFLKPELSIAFLAILVDDCVVDVFEHERTDAN